MRPTSTYPDALNFLPVTAVKAGRRTTLLATARIALEAVSDGLDADHAYQALRAGGVAPDAAARRVFADHFAAR